MNNSPAAPVRRIVAVTGAGAGARTGTGIGRATAHAFAARGATVLAVGRRPGPLEEAAAGDGRIVPLVEDITGPGEPERIVRTAQQTYGRLNVLVNNAALVRSGALGSLSTAMIEPQVATNLVAPTDREAPGTDPAAADSTPGVATGPHTSGLGQQARGSGPRDPSARLAGRLVHHRRDPPGRRWRGGGVTGVDGEVVGVLIGEPAEATGTTARAQRQHEQAGPISSQRAANRYRVYEERTVVRVRDIRHLPAAGCRAHIGRRTSVPAVPGRRRCRGTVPGAGSADRPRAAGRPRSAARRPDRGEGPAGHGAAEPVRWPGPSGPSHRSGSGVRG